MLTENYGSIEIFNGDLEENSCPICLLDLDAQVHRLGCATIHTGEGGRLHPMHKKCFYESVKTSGKCPICRIEVPLDAFYKKKKSLAQRVAVTSLGFTAVVSYHFLMTSITGSSRLSAAIPGIIGTGFSLRQVYYEHKDLLLRRSLQREIMNELFLGVITTAVPLVATVIAESATDSPIKNSCITTAVSIASLGVFLKLFVTINTEDQKLGII